MPGIFGIINRKDKAVNLHDLDTMLSSMMHEKFYKSGKYIEEDLGFYGGWVNIRNSFSDCMPVTDPKRKLALLFYGENIQDEAYLGNYLKLNKKTYLKAEYLLDLYKVQKDQFFNNLNGFFNGLLVDNVEKNIKLFVDRYGMHRLYYYEDKSEFIFASEAKAILAIRPQLKKINLDSLGEYLSCGCVLKNKTLFENIKLIPGGALWTFSQSGAKKENYFEPEILEHQSTLNEQEFVEKIILTFTEIVKKYLIPEGKVGLSLTGGLDTRMILAASNVAPGSLPCFTYGGVYRDSYDVKVSKKVADACNQQHHVIRADKEFIKNFFEYARKAIYISDGCADITAAPNLYVTKKARDISTIRLTGNYGQELLRRYIAFRPGKLDKKIFNSDFVKYLDQAGETYHSVRESCDQLTFALFKQAPWYQYGRYSVESSQITQRSPFLDNELVKLVYQAPTSMFDNEEISNRIIMKSKNNIGRIATDLGKLGTKPFLLMELFRAWRYFLFKMEWYYNHRLPRSVEKIDNYLRPLGIEEWFLGRNKYYHMRTWLREELSNFVKDILLSTKCKDRGIFNSHYVEEVVLEHIRGNVSNTDMLCALLTAELALDILIDS